MKRILLTTAAVLVLLSAGLYALNNFIYREKQADRNSIAKYVAHENGSIGIAFDYREEPDGYVLLEPQATSENPDFMKIYVLMRKEDHASWSESAVATESPPAISIAVYKNSTRQWPAVWADANKQESNIALKIGDEAEAAVGGAKAIRYQADGLYRSDNAVVAHGDFIFVITGEYLEEDSALRRDFEPFLRSVSFIRTSDQP